MFAFSKSGPATVAGIFALGIWSFSGGSAPAALLNPGGNSTALTGTYASVIANDNYVTSQTKAYSGIMHGLVFDFSLTTTVYSDPNTGGDDFVYQLANTAPNNSNSDSFDRLTLSSFSGFSVDADYAANTGLVQQPSPNPPIAGDVAPTEVDLSSDGSVLGYRFNPSDPVGPTGETDLLVVLTDSTTYTYGSATVIDNAYGVVLTDVPYGASVVVPEPGSLAIIAMSLGVLARRRHLGR